MQAKMPMTASDNMKEVPEDEKAVRNAPRLPPKKQIIRALRLLKRSAKYPQGSEERPNSRYMGKPSSSTPFRSIFRESIRGMASTGKAIS